MGQTVRMPALTLPALGTVLCAVDASPHAAAVLHTAAGFAQPAQAKLLVLRVDGRAARDDTAMTAARTELGEFVRGVLPDRLSYSERVDLMVGTGDVAADILQVAVDEGAGLIVIGTHARGAIGRMLLGSTAERVVRDATVPVMIVPPGDPEIVSVGDWEAAPHLGRILVPVDLHDAARRQLQVAARLSTASAHRLVLLHVMSSWAHEPAALASLREISEGVASAVGVRLLAVEGGIPATIATIAGRERAGLVVMGRDRTAAGAIARKVLRESNAVVVVVP